MKCYICGSGVKRVWQNKGIRLICGNQQCKTPQDDVEAYTAKKYKIKEKLTMTIYATLTERAVIKLNHIALTLHYLEFRKRLDRLHGRLIGDRRVVVVVEIEEI